jgi:16S rRNA (cytosine967-C5)-methyltransferase
MRLPSGHPKIIHHAVEQSKRLVNRFEQGFLNAVLRKLPEALARIDRETSPAAHFSHPEWLVTRWKREFPDNYAELLEWNQSTPESYLKLYTRPGESSMELVATQWDQFYRLDRAASWKDVVHPLLNRGDAYIKDPSTRLAPALLAPRAGERVLDLCAAPGGKAFDLAHAMGMKGTLVAVDLPGPRIARLQSNLESLQSDTLHCHVLESDLLELGNSQLEQAALPCRYDAVMLDAPCSNTGVIQRRTDVKWRLRDGDIEDCARLQKSLLAKAAEFVDAGGRLVYSTCSIEAAENREVVDAFLASEPGRSFELVDESISLPWETGHDGAGAFLLKRVSQG